MKTIGLLGGLSWESTLEYYRTINRTVKERLGGLNSAKIVLYSVNFAELIEYDHHGKSKKAVELIINAAKSVESGGADCLLICTNTIHKMYKSVQKRIDIPILHIADAAAEKIKEKKLRKVGLLGTKPTMEMDFYKKRLTEKHDIETVIPEESDREIVHSIIFGELVLGKFLEKSKIKYLDIIKKLQSKGAEGVILGCTEIPLLIKQEDCKIPVFDTTTIHAQAAVNFALN